MVVAELQQQNAGLQPAESGIGGTKIGISGTRIRTGGTRIRTGGTRIRTGGTKMLNGLEVQRQIEARGQTDVRRQRFVCGCRARTVHYTAHGLPENQTKQDSHSPSPLTK